MKAGGSCQIFADLELFTTINEIRFTRGNSDTHSGSNIEKSLDYKIPFILNIDSYITDSNRGWNGEKDLTDFTNWCINYAEVTARKKNITLYQLDQLMSLTFDNEANEIYSPRDYGYFLKLFNKIVNNRYSIGAGNFGSDPNHKNKYEEYILSYCSNCFKFFDYHLQDGFTSQDLFKNNKQYYLDLFKKYNIKYSRCTEANYTDPSKLDNFNLLKDLAKYAAFDLQSSAFCLVFISNANNKWGWLSFKYNDKIRSKYWIDLIALITIYNREEIQDLMKLSELKVGDKNVQVRALQKSLKAKNIDVGLIDGWFGSKTLDGLRQYNKKHNINPDSTCTFQTWYELLNDDDTSYLIRDIIDLLNSI